MAARFRRMLDAYVTRCTDRETVYRQHAQFAQDYQCWGHWAHKRLDTKGRMYYLSPEVILGNARGTAVESTRLRRIFRLRQLTRQVRQQGHIRLHNFGIYVDQNLWGQTAAGWYAVLEDSPLVSHWPHPRPHGGRGWHVPPAGCGSAAQDPLGLDIEGVD